MKLVELPSPNWAKLQNYILNFISHITKNFPKVVKSSLKFFLNLLYEHFELCA